MIFATLLGSLLPCFDCCHCVPIVATLFANYRHLVPIVTPCCNHCHRVAIACHDCCHLLWNFSTLFQSLPPWCKDCHLVANVTTLFWLSPGTATQSYNCIWTCPHTHLKADIKSKQLQWPQGKRPINFLFSCQFHSSTFKKFELNTYPTSPWEQPYLRFQTESGPALTRSTSKFLHCIAMSLFFLLNYCHRRKFPWDWWQYFCYKTCVPRVLLKNYYIKTSLPPPHSVGFPDWVTFILLSSLVENAIARAGLLEMIHFDI